MVLHQTAAAGRVAPLAERLLAQPQNDPERAAEVDAGLAALGQALDAIDTEVMALIERAVAAAKAIRHKVNREAGMKNDHMKGVDQVFVMLKPIARNHLRATPANAVVVGF